jgi:ATP-dependent helicase HrpB
VLPIEPLLPELLTTLRQHGRLVLQAPPGAGKTTRVPLALAAEPPWNSGTVLVLEPRRLSAKLAARQMARSLGEAVGDTVGYRVRLDRCVGPRTRVELLTDGLFLRRLQDDPALTGVTAVQFDEVHERGVGSDLALALTWQARQLLVPDLAVVVMSATLDAAPLARLLDDAPVLSSDGRAHPVRTHYADRPAPDRPTVAAIADQVRPALRRVLAEEEGSVLVFLPGQAEIRRLAEQLDDLPADVDLRPLYGDLDAAGQEAAVAPPPPGRRKLVLATALAESSLTLDGIRVVVDAGWSRVARFDPVSGLGRLETGKASQAQADQRRGRAGRQGPGVCHRLWTPLDQQRRPLQPLPEILGSDPAPLALELALWGAGDGEGLAFLDPPPPAGLAEARRLLQSLGAIDDAGRPTTHGRELATLGLHPRLGAMVLAAAGLPPPPPALDLPAWGPSERTALACALAALLGERDPLRGQATGADVALRLERLTGPVRQLTQQLRRQRQLPAAVPLLPDGWPAWTGVLLALAYPDRLALPRDRERPGVVLLANGRGAALEADDPLVAAEALVVAHLDGDRRQARIRLAAPLPRAALAWLQPGRLQQHDTVGWDDGRGQLLARRQWRLGALLLEDQLLARPAPAQRRQALLAQLRRGGLGQLGWTAEQRQLRGRLAFLQGLDPDGWSAVDDATLLTQLDDWLGPALEGVLTLAELQRLDLAAALLDRLDWRQRSQLDQLAPVRWPLPGGRGGRIDYTGEEPVLSSRLQDFFGLTEGPRLADGRHALLLHLLSPAGRPAAVTRDLASFWRQGYPLVRKDLRGRYPRHRWPEDPLAPP